MLFPHITRLFQEPGTPKDIQLFAQEMGAKFTMFDKCDVKGKSVSPVYAFLKDMTGKVGGFFDISVE